MHYRRKIMLRSPNDSSEIDGLSDSREGGRGANATLERCCC